MGYVSQDCNRCGHPALSPEVTTPGVNEWMTEVVAITPNESILKGRYNGYGCINGFEEVVGADASVYHRACWELTGEPIRYTGPSDVSADQGYHFDAGEHDVTDPRLPAPSAGREVRCGFCSKPQDEWHRPCQGVSHGSHAAKGTPEFTARETEHMIIMMRPMFPGVPDDKILEAYDKLQGQHSS